MLRDLVEYARRHKADLLPPGYRKMEPIRWVIHVSDDGSSRIDPIENEQARPSINRSSGVEPLLLADTAEYVLGLPKSEKERDTQRAAQAREAFWGLLRRVEDESKDEAVRGLSLAAEHLPPPPDGMTPKDVVLVRRKGQPDPLARDAVRRFWAKELETKLAGDAAQCGACGHVAPLLRIMPTGVKGFPQDVKLSSINLDSFESFGFKQGENAPLCFDCGMLASSALSHLLENHKLILTRDDRSSLSTEFAVFWLKNPQVETPDGPQDLSRLLHIALVGKPPAAAADEDRAVASVEEVELLLKTPWKPRESALTSDPKAFHLAILSANVSRLVVRAWFHGSLRELQANLGSYIERTKMVGPWGETPHGLPLKAMLDALGAYKARGRWEANPPPGPLVRAVLESAYRGTKPPRELVPRAVQVLRNPTTWTADWLVSRLTATIRYGLTNTGENSMSPSATLDKDRLSQAYLCGRLFAILERAQGIHSNWKLNASLVERSYGAASTRPRTVFPPLINVATTAHLRAAGKLNVEMDRTMSNLQRAGGFPATLTLQQQGEFALGFYQQRAAFRAASQEKKEEEKE